MKFIGEFTGELIVLLFLFETLRFVLRFVSKKYGRRIKEKTKFYPNLLNLMNLSKKYHSTSGYVIVLLIILHATVQTEFFNLINQTSLLGIIAAILMILEVALGIIGTYLLKKPRPKYWVWLHRITPLVVIVAILLHTQFK